MKPVNPGTNQYYDSAFFGISRIKKPPPSRKKEAVSSMPDHDLNPPNGVSQNSRKRNRLQYLILNLPDLIFKGCSPAPKTGELVEVDTLPAPLALNLPFPCRHVLAAIRSEYRFSKVLAWCKTPTFSIMEIAHT
jgi:hypothetical protein